MGKTSTKKELKKKRSKEKKAERKNEGITSPHEVVRFCRRNEKASLPFIFKGKSSKILRKL